MAETKKKKDKPASKPASPVDALMKLDKAAHDAARPWRETPAVKALSWYSELGDQPQMLSLSGGVMAAGLLGGDRRLVKTGARMIAAHLLATYAKNFIKARVDRSRPRSASGRDGHHPRPGRNEEKEETSFPSGHSAGAAAVAQAMARDHPEFRSVAWTAGGAIAFAQIPRCAHYPTDIAAGLAIGIAAEQITSTLLDAAWDAAAGRLRPAELPATG